MGPFSRKPVMMNQPVYQRPPPPNTAGSVDQAINTGALRENHLSARIAKLEQTIAGHMREMQRTRPGTSAHNAAKRRAHKALQQKKMLDSQADAVSGSLFNLENAKDLADQQAFHKQQVVALKQSTAMLKQSDVDLDQIDEIRDDMDDAVADAQEAQRMFSQPFGDVEMDADEIDAELEAFANDDFHAESAAVAPAAAAPSYLNPAPVPGGSYQPPAPYQTPGQQNPNANPANYY